MRLERRDWRGPLWGKPWQLQWPLSGGCPRRTLGSALRWGRGRRSQRRATAWLGARGPLCPEWGWRGWCRQWCPQGLGLGHPVLQTRMRERGQPYPDTLFRRRSNNLATFQQPVPATFWRPSSGRPNVARTSPEQVVGTSPEQWKIDTVPRAHRARCVHYGPVGGGGGIYYKWHNPSRFMGMGQAQ